MPRPSGYDLTSYGEMVDCEPRMGVFAEALKRAVTPGCTVVDIGASFGIFALLACKYGAGRVIAIEPDPSVELIMPFAQANGCADKITVIRDISTHYTPDTKADVIISDVRGTMPLYEKHIETIVDARSRLLKPDGDQMPMRDTIRIALAHAPEIYRPCHHPWAENDYGVDLSLGKKFSVNTYHRADLDEDAMVSQACDLAVIDYRTVTDPDLDSTVELEALKDAVAHGLLLWFDAEIAEGLTYSNAPGEPPLVYSQMLMPFAETVKLRTGDRVKARIRAKLMDHTYIWSWDSTIIDGQTGETRHSFEQSTFKGEIFSRKELDQISNLSVPKPSSALAMDRDCLSLVGEGRNVDEIAEILMQRHPDQLKNHADALARTTSLLKRYVNGNN